MYILYADESGHPSDPNQLYFVLAGVSVFAQQTLWLTEKLNKIAAQFEGAAHGYVELHGSPMFTGKNTKKLDWRLFSRKQRNAAIAEVLHTLAH